MYSFFGGLLHKPSQFYKLIFLFSISLYSILFYGPLLTPLSELAIVLFMIQNGVTIKKTITLNTKSIGIRFFGYTMITMIGTAIYIIIRVFVTNFNLKMTPGMVTLIYLLIFIIWHGRLTNNLYTKAKPMIFRYQTKLKSKYFMSSRKNFVYPLGLVIIYFILRFFFSSLVSTEGKSMTSTNEIIWLSPILFLIPLLFIDGFFNGQIKWKVGITNTQLKIVSYSGLTPNVDDPESLEEYFEYALTLEPIPEDIMKYLDDNLEKLSKYCETNEYLKFIVFFVHCIANWGFKSREYIHILHILVLSQLVKYRIYGLIPLYKRELFYNYLTCLSKTGLLSPEWKELIDFESTTDKDEFHVLDWIVGKPFDKSYFSNTEPWWTIWENNIYCNKEGYDLARVKIDGNQWRPKQLSEWEIDVNQISLDYVKQFIGSKGRQVLVGDQQLHSKMQFVAQKKLLKDFEVYQEKNKTSRKTMEESLSLGKTVETKQIRTEEEKKAIIKATLLGTEANSEPVSFNTKIVSFGNQLKFKLTKINPKFLYVNGLIVFLAFLNVYGILFIRDQYSLQFYSIILGLEFIILSFLLLDPATRETAIMNRYQNMKQHETYGELVINFEVNNKIIIFLGSFLLFLILYI